MKRTELLVHAGKVHMNVTHPKRFFDAMGLFRCRPSNVSSMFNEPHVWWCYRTAAVTLPPIAYVFPTRQPKRLNSIASSSDNQHAICCKTMVANAGARDIALA